MRLSDIENADLDDFTYYEIIRWKDKNKSGEHSPIAYKHEGTARNNMKKMLASGKYEMIVLRKVEAIKRRSYCEFSISTPIAKEVV